MRTDDDEEKKLKEMKIELKGAYDCKIRTCVAGEISFYFGMHKVFAT